MRHGQLLEPAGGGREGNTEYQFSNQIVATALRDQNNATRRSDFKLASYCEH